MRSRLLLFGVLSLIAATLTGCKTNVLTIAVVCQMGNPPAEPVTWYYANKIDRLALLRIPPAVQIVLHYTGSRPRPVPPVNTYFYRDRGAVLRVMSSATATVPPKGTFAYHVDTGGYYGALNATGREEREQLEFVVEVDGRYFHGLLSHPACARLPTHDLAFKKTDRVPDLRNRHPLNMGEAEWVGINDLPTAVMRKQNSETSTFAYFPGPIPLTEARNQATPPDNTTKQLAEIGVSPTTPLFPLPLIAPNLAADPTPLPSAAKP
jgi:hypothetical protein